VGPSPLFPSFLVLSSLFLPPRGFLGVSHSAPFDWFLFLSPFAYGWSPPPRDLESSPPCGLAAVPRLKSYPFPVLPSPPLLDLSPLTTASSTPPLVQPGPWIGLETPFFIFLESPPFEDRFVVFFHFASFTRLDAVFSPPRRSGPIRHSRRPRSGSFVAAAVSLLPPHRLLPNIFCLVAPIFPFTLGLLSIFSRAYPLITFMDRQAARRGRYRSFFFLFPSPFRDPPLLFFLPPTAQGPSPAPPKVLL